MASPVLVAVYDDPDTLAALEQTLQTRFGPDYQVLTAATPTAALDSLRQLRQGGDQVALVLADQWLAGMTGVELLCQAHALHPTAKRALFITYGDAAAGTAGLQAMALGQLDLYLNARAPHRLVGRLRRPGRAGFPAHRPRPAPQRQATPRLAPGPTTAAAGDQPARRLRRRRHPPRLGQTRRLGRRRRRHRHATRPRIPSRTLGTYGRADLEPCRGHGHGTLTQGGSARARSAPRPPPRSSKPSPGWPRPCNRHAEGCIASAGPDGCRPGRTPFAASSS